MSLSKENDKDAAGSSGADGATDYSAASSKPNAESAASSYPDAEMSHAESYAEGYTGGYAGDSDSSTVPPEYLTKYYKTAGADSTSFPKRESQQSQTSSGTREYAAEDYEDRCMSQSSGSELTRSFTSMEVGNGTQDCFALSLEEVQHRYSLRDSPTRAWATDSANLFRGECDNPYVPGAPEGYQEPASQHPGSEYETGAMAGTRDYTFSDWPRR